jgi:hypothetical protein
MLERNFSGQFRKEYKSRYPLAHVILLQDAPMGGKKPYDAYTVQGEIFTALEFKVEAGASIKADCLKQHQYDSLFEVHKAGGNGIIVVLCEKIKKVFVCDIVQWDALFSSIDGNFIKYQDLDSKNFIERKRYDEATSWDMKTFKALAWQ